MPERQIKKLRIQRFGLVVVLVALALAIAGGAVLYAVSHNRDNITNAERSTEVVCEQVLKLRAALIKNVNNFEGLVVAGYKRRPPGEEATPEERSQTAKFFDGQRTVLEAVNCP